MLCSVAGAPLAFLGGLLGSFTLLIVGLTLVVAGVLAATGAAVTVSRRTGKTVGQSLRAGFVASGRWSWHIG